MSRKRRKVKKQRPSDEQMKIAAALVMEEKRSNRKVAKELNISHNTLSKYIKMIKEGKEANMGYKFHNKVLNPENEKKFYEMISKLSDNSDGLTRKEIRCLVYQFAVEENLKFPERWKVTKMAGEDWLASFIKSHPTLSIRKSKKPPTQEKREENNLSKEEIAAALIMKDNCSLGEVAKELNISHNNLSRYMKSIREGKEVVKKQRPSDEQMKIGATLVMEEKCSNRKVAKELNVSPSTISRYIQMIKEGKEVVMGYKFHNKVLNPENEKRFCEYLSKFSDKSDGLTRKELRCLVYQFVVEENLKCPENWKEKKMAGKDWLASFIKSQPTLSLRKPVAKYAGKHLQKNYVCYICGKWLATQSSIIAHLKVHNDDKQYICANCGKAFVRKHHLVNHVRTHTKEKPYKCTICNKCYTQSGTLAIHMRDHTGEKPYKCHICEKSFVSNTLLKSHLARH